MKVCLSLLASSLVLLVACSNSDNSAGTPAKLHDVKDLSLTGFTEEKALSQDEYYKLIASYERPNCDRKSFDTSLIGSTFKGESSYTKLGGPSYYQRTTETVTEVTANRSVATINYDQISISDFSGQVYVDNRAVQTCTLEITGNGSKIDCNVEGKLTSAAEEYVRTRTPQISEDCETEFVQDGRVEYFAKGFYILENGRRVSAALSSFQNKAKIKCKGNDAARNVTVSYVTVASPDVKDRPDDLRCGAVNLFSRYIRQNEQNAVEVNSLQRTYSAPSR